MTGVLRVLGADCSCHKNLNSVHLWWRKVCGWTCVFFHRVARFGDGYTIILRLADNRSDTESCPIDAYMRRSFPVIELKERHQSVLQYQLPSHACCLARIFDVLANNHEELGVVDFSVSQTTLDQVRKRIKAFSSLKEVYEWFCNYRLEKGCHSEWSAASNDFGVYNSTNIFEFLLKLLLSEAGSHPLSFYQLYSWKKWTFY